MDLAAGFTCRGRRVRRGGGFVQPVEAGSQFVDLLLLGPDLVDQQAVLFDEGFDVRFLGGDDDGCERKGDARRPT